MFKFTSNKVYGKTNKRQEEIEDITWPRRDMKFIFEC